jgi:hypothetical protein
MRKRSQHTTAIPNNPVHEWKPGPTIVAEVNPPAGGPAPPLGYHVPQGEHGAAGGLPRHHQPDGGLGLGNQAPPSWPDYSQKHRPNEPKSRRGKAK